MPGPRRRTSNDETDYGLLLMFLGVIILGLFYVAFVAIIRFAPGPDHAVPITLLVLSMLLALAAATAFCILGSMRHEPWMRRFRWIWWIILDDDDDYDRSIEPPAPDSAAGAVTRVVDQIGETVKNAVIDFGVSDAAAPRPPNPPPLPPMTRNDFLAALRPRVEDILSHMADEINNAPTGSVIDVSKERVHPLLDELEDEVLTQGLRLRIDAAYAALPQERRPQGEWARRYRMMMSSRRRN